MIKVAIIILNWQQPQLTINTLNSFRAIIHRHFDYHIYLIDNGSQDDSFKILSRYVARKSNVSLHQTGSNLGFVGGNNYGLKLALKDKSDYVLLANNDIIVNSAFLDCLVNAATQHPGFGALGPKIYFAPGFEFHKNRYTHSEVGRVIWSAGGKMDWRNILGSNIGVDEVDHGQYDSVTTDLDFLTGCCLLLRTKAIRQVGLLDDMYLEDVDYCQRLKQKNWQLAYIPTSKIWHINSGSSKSGSNLHDYYITRNRLIFALKYADLRAKLALFRESVKYLISPPYPIRRQAVYDFYSLHWGRGDFK